MERAAQLRLLLALGVLGPLAALLSIPRAPVVVSLSLAAAVAFVGFRWTNYLIPILAPRCARAGLVGKDINKRGLPSAETPIPESLGLAPGVVTIVCLAVVHLLHKFKVAERILVGAGFLTPDSVSTAEVDPWTDDFPAALASITLMLMLGFVDDVLDLPWRVKLVMPIVASMPLLAAYSGATAVGIPRPIVDALGLSVTYIELGPLYYVYMVMLVIFCTNSINILAGINGLEAGQTFLVASAILVHNMLQLCRNVGGQDQERTASQLFSAYVMLPLLATTFGLLCHNWFPSSVFVGDTYAYFAGMSIAVAGILGHFSETLLVFLIPQVFNFVYSLPQLFGIVHCPRHRLPLFDPSTGLLSATPNWNVVNLMLYLGGPCTELWLCIRILTVQALTCTLGIALHWILRGAWKL